MESHDHAPKLEQEHGAYAINSLLFTTVVYFHLSLNDFDSNGHRKMR